MHDNITNLRQVAIGSALGVSLIGLSALVYARLTVVDPYMQIAGPSRLLSDIIAFVHFAAIVVFWGRASVVISGPGFAGALVSGISSLLALFALASAAGIELTDVLRLYIGMHAWWAVLVLAAAVFPFIRTRSSVSGGQIGSRPWIVAAASFFTGVLIHMVSSNGPSSLIFVEALLVLVIPSMCLNAIAIGYRGQRPIFLRSIAGLGAIISAAIATIR